MLGLSKAVLHGEDALSITLSSFSLQNTHSSLPPLESAAMFVVNLVPRLIVCAYAKFPPRNLGGPWKFSVNISNRYSFLNHAEQSPQPQSFEDAVTS